MNALLLDGMTVIERGWLSSNIVVFASGKVTAIVDSGYATHAQQSVALVQATLNGRPLDYLINTHLHSDHCGGNAAIQQNFPGVRTAIPQADALTVSNWDETRLTYHVTGQQCPKFNFQQVIGADEEILIGDRTWKALCAPGHDPHSLILYEPDSRILISADALWEHGFGVVFPELDGEQSFAEVAKTLDLIESLEAKVVVPGHGTPFTTVSGALVEARGRLARFRAHPERHAWHALKVLCKFRLLELHHVPISEFYSWIFSTPYFKLIQKRFFSEDDLESLALRVLDDLIRAGQATIDHGRVYECTPY